MIRYLNLKLSLTCVSLFILLLSSCASRVTTIQNDENRTIEQGQGYLLLGLSSDLYLEFIVIDGEKKIMFTKDDVRYNEDYLFTPLPPGDYRIKSVKTGQYTGYELLGDIWSFSVSPGTVSYVGDFQINRKNRSNEMQIINRSSYAYSFMKANFPNLLSKNPMTYTKEKEDRFFELMQSGEDNSHKGVKR
ncbi:hypothetical protein [uncultured Pseudoteredinibacter sp.]|uniref:MSCRAMM family protein n=1 Tax=uncultured Pseudoteredinibacter sp. TaxID=1641701 RepID=UPI00262DAA51|nr:hypothetical protein [uncultured Pseudoteredinibacter sp.]